MFERIANGVDHLMILVTSDKRHQFLEEYADNIIEIPKICDSERISKLVQAYLNDRGLTLSGILTYDDWWIELTSKLCEIFEIPEVRYTRTNIVTTVRDKFQLRQICNSMDEFYQCKSKLLKEESFDVSDMSFPCILKPQKGAGSFFCKKVQDENELRAEFLILRNQFENFQKTNYANSFDVMGKHFLVEELVHGEEFDVDGYCVNSEIILNLVSWNEASDEYGSEYGGLYPANFPPEHSASITSSLSALLKNLGSVSGFFHFEGMLLNTGEIFPIELNLRVGGAEAPYCFRHLTGIHPADVLSSIALGSEIPCPSGEFVPNGFVRSTNHRLETEGIITSIEISPELEKSPWHVAHSVFFKAGQKYTRKYNGSMGCVYWLAASGETAKLAEEHLRELQEFIKIETIEDAK